MRTPAELDEVIEMIRAHLVDNAIRELEATAIGAEPFASCYEKPGYPDLIHNHFECTSCGLRFDLVVETYHGTGGSWEIDPGSVTGSESF